MHTHEQAKKQTVVRETCKNSEGNKLEAESELLMTYSTYLHPKKIKQIKWRALERDTKDMRIVQEAIDEYFERHPTA